MVYIEKHDGVKYEGSTNALDGIIHDLMNFMFESTEFKTMIIAKFIKAHSKDVFDNRLPKKQVSAEQNLNWTTLA